MCMFTIKYIDTNEVHSFGYSPNYILAVRYYKEILNSVNIKNLYCKITEVKND